ncbi:FUSC family protein [bacterium]|nr:FUSC family protein [bacterium]MBU1884517.1 FUSC family protein [bacterium]
MQSDKAILLNLTLPLYLKRVALEWLALDAPTLIYMAKATFAGLFALIISMVLNLPDPRTAIFTTFIVMQPQSGLVFSKSYYRVIGTTVGVGISLLMMGMFAQDQAWFITFFALWIGIMTAAGVKYRNFQSYGFVLAGYTLCIVALPVIEMPLEIFDIAVSRFSEVLVGIMSATIISDVVFPRKLSDSLLSSERERFANLVATLADEKSIFEIQEDAHAHMTRFSGGVVGLHAIRINSSFESGADRKNRQHSQSLNQEYMNLSTTFHSLKNVIIAIEPRTPPEVLEKLAKLYRPIGSVLKSCPMTPLGVDDISCMVDQLLSVKKDVDTFFVHEQNSLKSILDSDSYDAFISAANLIVRLLNELYIYCVTYLSFVKHRISGKSSKDLSRVVRFSTHTDNVLVALAALRGSGVLLVSMMFWIFSGWPYATLTVTLAVVIGLLIGTLPSPLDAVKNFFKGGVSAVIVAAVYDFYIIPEYTTDMWTLSLVIAPVLAIVAWLTTQPKWSGFSLGFIFLFMYQCSLDPYYKVDPTVFMESTLAYLIGIIFAGTAYLLVNFWSCSLTQRRVAKILRRQIVSLSKGAITVQRSSLESMGRDLVQQFSTHGRLNMRSSRLVFEWLLSTLELGRAIIAVRRNMKKLGGSYGFIHINRSVYVIKNYFENPSEAKLEVLLVTLRETLEILEDYEKTVEKVYRKRVHAIIGELALIRTIMLTKSSLPIVMEDSCP